VVRTTRVLPEFLLEILVCPKTKGPLVYFPEDGLLLAPHARLRYRVDDGVPVLLVEEAQELTADETERLLARARTLGLRVPT
jgi:uncharacterized protein